MQDYNKDFAVQSLPSDVVSVILSDAAVMNQYLALFYIFRAAIRNKVCVYNDWSDGAAVKRSELRS